VGKHVALVIKRTTWERARERPEDPLHELLARGDATVASVLGSYEEHAATLGEVEAALLESQADVTRIRRQTPRFDEQSFDLVISVGGDGTLLRTSHFVGTTPVLGVNSAPTYSVGFFCGARKGDAGDAVRRALAGEMPAIELSRMQVAVNRHTVHARVLNDALFCHQSPAATSRYIIEHGEASEEQKSSGFWIGPAAGSTAAQRSAGGQVLPLASPQLQIVVREPYTPHGDRYRLAHVLIEPNEILRVRSKSRRMRLFLDGPDEVFRVTIGDVVEFTRSAEPLRLLGIADRSG
jgi:NAD+ kinase